MFEDQEDKCSCNECEVIKILGDDGRELVSLIIHSPIGYGKEFGFIQ